MIKKNKRLDIITRLADALAVNREPDAPKEMCASDIADLEALEAALSGLVWRACQLISDTTSPIVRSISFAPTMQGRKPKRK